VTQLLAHSDNERQLSVNNFWSCILGNQGVTWMYEFITVLFTASVLLNITHKRKNIDSKIPNAATCTVFKTGVWDASWAIFIKYSCRMTKARAVYECTDGPAGQPTDNPPNSDGLGAIHRTVPELTAQVYLQPGPRIGWWFGSNPDPDLKRWSETVAYTRQQHWQPF